MGMPGWAQILVVVLLIILLFGRNKISDIMGDMAKGIRSFKKGLNEDPTQSEEEPKSIAHQSAGDVESPAVAEDKQKHKA